VQVTVEPLTVLTAFLTPKKKPLIFGGVGTYSIEPFRSRWAKGIFKRAWKRPHRILAISDYTKKKIEQFHGSCPITVIPLGVSLTEAMKNSKPIWTSSPQILGVGEVKRRKDFLNVIEGLALLKKQIPNAKLVVAGSTSSKPEMERISQAVKKNKLEKCVDFRGFVSDEDLKKLYQESQLFVMTSLSSEYHFEGFGLVYLEANGYGLPSIGSLESGASSAIEDGMSGKLVPAGNPTALVTAMREILYQKETWQQYSGNAKKFAESMNWNTYATKIEAVYRELV
jgi:glycosyltransferase involved in cell wall biosynthesis